MQLSDNAKAILDNTSGRAPRKAMELIVRYAMVLGAERLCRVTWADLFCGAHDYLDGAGFGPVALAFLRFDSRTAVTAAVLNLPLVTDLETDPFDLIHVGDRVRVDGDRGVIAVLGAGHIDVDPACDEP